MEKRKQYDFDKLASKLVNGINYSQSPEWRDVAENCKKQMADIGNAVKRIYESEAMQSISKLAKQVQKITITLPKVKTPQIEFSEEMKKNIKKYKCLKYLEKMEWPLYLLIDDNLLSVMDPFIDDEKNNKEDIKKVILEFLSDEYISNLASNWKNGKAINYGRIAALEESVKLFEEGYFYGCTALLACQVEGIISDIYKMQTDAGKIVSVEDFRMAYEYYNPDKKFSNSIKRKSERNQLLEMASETDDGFFYWMAVIGYLYKIILTSDKEMNQSDHPCRNKICHGVQLNYGTREHAVKAILMIDMTIKFGEKMKIILEKAPVEQGDNRMQRKSDN